MKKRVPILALAIALSLLSTIPVHSQFQAGVNLGSDLLPSLIPGGGSQSWTKLGFQPDLALGKFGVGLDLTLRFKLYPNATTPIEIYSPDWVPQTGQSILDVYLPKLMYVRYGLRGVDPFNLKLGSITDLTLGNGFIVGDYANTRFMPATRLFGLQLGIDGSAIRFPYFGLEAITGNLARLDVVGARFYLKPFGGAKGYIPSSLQIGVTGVVDQNPLTYVGASQLASYPAKELLYVAGADLTAPLVRSGIFSLAAFAEGAREFNGAMGAATGVGGKALGFVKYGAQIRYFQSGFIPTYFDNNYDLYRAERFAVMKSTTPGAWTPGWLANLGFTLFNEKISFSAGLDGPFKAMPATATSNQADYPHFKAKALLAEGVVSGISLDGVYEKYFLGRAGAFFQDLVNPKDATVGLAVHYKTGATVLTLSYDYNWIPDSSASAGGTWDVNSSLTATVRF